MKLRVVMFLLLSAVGSTAAGEPSTREALVAQIEAQYTQSGLIPQDSPFVANLLQPAKSANPGVSDEIWASITAELASAESALLIEKGGLLDSLIQSATEPLSDEELQKILAMLSDPAYKKFQAAMSGSETHKQLAKAIAELAMRLTGTVNQVLVKHGLKEVH